MNIPGPPIGQLNHGRLTRDGGTGKRPILGEGEFTTFDSRSACLGLHNLALAINFEGGNVDAAVFAEIHRTCRLPAFPRTLTEPSSAAARFPFGALGMVEGLST
jgi:hypothetical protein